LIFRAGRRLRRRCFPNSRWSCIGMNRYSRREKRDFEGAGSMEEPQIYARLAEVFQDVFDEAITVTPELSAKDVDGWDSITHIRLMLTVERAFKIKFSAPEIGKLKNVSDLVTLIKART